MPQLLKGMSNRRCMLENIDQLSGHATAPDDTLRLGCKCSELSHHCLGQVLPPAAVANVV